MVTVLREGVEDVHGEPPGGSSPVERPRRAAPQDPASSVEVAEQGALGEVGRETLPAPALAERPAGHRRVPGSRPVGHGAEEERPRRGQVPVAHAALPRRAVQQPGSRRARGPRRPAARQGGQTSGQGPGWGRAPGSTRRGPSVVRAPAPRLPGPGPGGQAGSRRRRRPRGEHNRGRDGRRARRPRERARSQGHRAVAEQEARVDPIGAVRQGEAVAAAQEAPAPQVQDAGEGWEPRQGPRPQGDTEGRRRVPERQGVRRRAVQRRGPQIGRRQAQQVSSACNRRIISQLDYKTSGADVVPEPYSSQTCPVCGCRQKCRRVYECRSCGFKAPRDVVGALNIRTIGLVEHLEPRADLTLPRITWVHPSKYPGRRPGSSGGTPASSSAPAMVLRSPSL